MPVCFQLISIETGIAATLQIVDAELCQHLDLPYSDTRYTCEWFDDLGLYLALGKTWDQLADIYKEGIAKGDRYKEHEIVMLRCVHYLRQRYTPECWHESK